MPLSRFDHGNSNHLETCPEPDGYLDILSADHLAGIRPRPDGRTPRLFLRSESLTEGGVSTSTLSDFPKPWTEWIKLDWSLVCETRR